MVLMRQFFIYVQQRQVFSALSQIAKHSVDLAEMVVEAEIFPAVLTCLKDSDEYVKKNVAMLIREIAKHTPEVHIIEFCLCVLHFVIYNVSLLKCSKMNIYK